MEHNQLNNNINLADCWLIIKKYQKLFICIIGVITLLSIIISLILPKYYKSVAVIMAIGPNNSPSIGSMGNLASMLGVGVGAQTPSQQMMALLKTRALAELVIKERNLIPVFFDGEDSNSGAMVMELAVNRLLRENVTFEDGKDTGTISISSEFKDPNIAAAVAESYVNGLQDFLNRNAMTVAKRHRLFTEEQLELSKRELLESGKSLNEFYKNERVSAVESMLDVSLLHSKSGDGRLKDLQQKKEDLDKKINDLKMVKDVPQQVYLQYLNLRKNLLTQVYTLLTQQYEMAKIQESKENLTFQVIDPPKIPELRSKPRRTQIVILAFVASVFLAIFTAFMLEYVRKIKDELHSRS